MEGKWKAIATCGLELESPALFWRIPETRK